MPKAPEPQETPTFSPELIKKRMSIHHLHCDWLKALGVDPCKEYTNQSVQAILKAVMAGDTVCPICSKPLKTTQRLRSNIKRQHMESTPMSAASARSLLVTITPCHCMRRNTGDKPFKCPAAGCTKSYPSASRLKEHSKVHDPTTSNFQSKYKCGKVFPEKRTVSSMRSTAPGDLSSIRSSVPTVPRRSKGSQISKDMQRNIMQAGI